MLERIEEKTSMHSRTSMLGKRHNYKRTRIIYHIICDACGRKLTRSKGEAYKLEEREKHACSPECGGKLSGELRKEKYIPRRARRKTGYIYIGKEREHRLVAAKKMGRALEKGELVHHVDGDKGHNVFENLYVCSSRQEHNRIHGQLEALAFLLVQQGKIKFNHEIALYEMTI